MGYQVQAQPDSASGGWTPGGTLDQRLFQRASLLLEEMLSRVLKIAAVFLSGFLSWNERSWEEDMTDLNRSFDENVYDLNAILHPGSVFNHPRDVLADAKLSRAEKRAILASW